MPTIRTLRSAKRGPACCKPAAQLAILRGDFFPQTQNVTGDYTRNAISRETANGRNITQQFYSEWNLGFNLSWELDFWGQFRRAIESGEANLEASGLAYDAAIVTLLGDVATDYVQMRTLQERDPICRNQRAAPAPDVDDRRSPVPRRHHLRA